MAHHKSEGIVFRDDLLEDRHILITGGGTGLGKSMGRRFLELGARLSICGRRQSVLQQTKTGFDRDFGDRTTIHVCDIRDAQAVETMIDEIWNAGGGLDALVNNAAGNFIARSEGLSPRAVDAVLNIVVHGTAYVTLACGRRWLDGRRPGNVLSIVATYALTGSGYVVPSAMGKAGVLAMTRSLAAEWGGRGVRLNAIAPGPFPTPGAWSRLVPSQDMERSWLKRIPLGRVGRHDELVNLAAYLLAEESGYVNGEVVTIDGGEWVKGAGEFNIMEELGEEDWAAMRRRKD